MTTTSALPDRSFEKRAAGPEAARAGDGILLALELRERTADAHREVERSLGLPQSISSVADYRACLNRFHGFYGPLEEALQRFAEWRDWDIALRDRAQTESLEMDLKSLELDLKSPEAAPAGGEGGREPLPVLPELREFAHALGALYVTEGSRLGSQFILRHLEEVLGKRIGRADRFFRGYGAETGAQWGQMRASLNRFGAERPGDRAKVIEGANGTFRAMGNWMAR